VLPDFPIFRTFNVNSSKLFQKTRFKVRNQGKKSSENVFQTFQPRAKSKYWRGMGKESGGVGGIKNSTQFFIGPKSIMMVHNHQTLGLVDG
jgi:hypothetical protein